MVTDSGFAERFTDLRVYRRAEDLAETIFEVSKGFPREEMYSLTDQMRRSSSSIGAQIAEAWGKRPYPRHFASKLTDADSERLETEHWIRVAHRRGYLKDEQRDGLFSELVEIGRMISSMRRKADLFGDGSSIIRDDSIEYDVP